MRKLLLFATIVLVAFSSCRKDNENSNPLIREAKDYFETVVQPDAVGTPSPEGVKYRFPEKKAEWDRANIQDLKFGKTVVVPLAMPSMKTRDHRKAEYKVEQNAFLLVYKDKEGKKHAEVVIKIPDENSEENRFSGIVVVTDWPGNLVQSYKYTYETETKVKTTMVKRAANAVPETLVLWCIAVDWIVCAQMTGYPVYCSYDYTTYFCFTENSSTPGSNPSTPPPGSCCGSYGSITGGNNTYPLAKEMQCIRFDTSIKLIQVRTCLTTIFQTLRQQKEGFWGKLIYDFTNQTPQFKWTITEGSVPGSVMARTGATTVASNINTTFNTAYLPDATNIAVARTMLHEAAHAYLTYMLPNTQNTYPQLYEDYNEAQAVTAPAQHQEMARSFVNDIASILKVYGQGLGIQAYDTYYMDMAWASLYGTTYFDALAADDKARILAINQAEVTGTPVTLPSGVVIAPLGTKVCQ